MSFSQKAVKKIPAFLKYLYVFDIRKNMWYTYNASKLCG